MLVAALLKKSHQTPAQLRCIARLALPYYHNLPSQCLQRSSDLGVTSAVAGEFAGPKLLVVFGMRPAPAIVLVPEAAVHEDCFSPRAESQIGTPR
jgi:hypothetical protein